MFDVVGFGALNVDKIFIVDKIPKADQGAHVQKEETRAGGSAANTVYDLTTMGFTGGYIGKVGDDPEGAYLLNSFGEVDTRGIIKEEGTTGVAYILVTANGDRAIVVNPGVNDFIEIEEIDLAYLHCTYLHLTSFACSQSSLSFEAQKELVKEINCRITFDPGHMYSSMGLEALREIVERAYAVFPTKEEIEMMTGLRYPQAAEKLLNLGCEIVVVTMGKEGCYLRTKEEEMNVPTEIVTVKDTTGAGDAFNAGFLAGLLEEKLMRECCELGNSTAARVIQQYGARI